MCENGRFNCSRFTSDFDKFTPIGYDDHINHMLDDSLREFSICLPSEFDIDTEAERSSHEWYYPSIISIVSRNLEEYSARPAYMNILDHTAPCSEPDTSKGDGMFRKRFGIPFQEVKSNIWFARAASTSEIIAAYSIPEDLLLSPSIVVDTIDNIDQLLAGGMPYKFRNASLNPDHQSTSIKHSFVEGQDEQIFTVQCYHISEKSDDWALNWDTVYQEDSTTKALIDMLFSA